MSNKIKVVVSFDDAGQGKGINIIETVSGAGINEEKKLAIILLAKSISSDISAGKLSLLKCAMYAYQAYNIFKS